MKKNLLISIVCVGILFLTSCAPSASQIQDAIKQTQAVWTPVPSQTAFPTYTPPPTIAIEVTRIVIVTTTYTPTPLYTPTITSTPTNTSTPTVTPNASQTAQAKLTAQLRADKGDGFYLVNVDIAPGVWRSTGSGDGCYWATTTKTGDIIDNHFGMSGGTAFISPNAFQVEFNGCGTWIFVSAP
jgi:hypothetical protein